MTERERAQEHMGRLKAMRDDVLSLSWDFSANDIDAIAWAVAEIDALRTFARAALKDAP